MVPFVRLWLISVLVAACRAFPSWYDCNPQNCQGPDCVCASLAPPGGLTPAETPQIITITHDDAVNPLSNKVMKAVIDKHTNPNGCNVPATWFTLQKGSDCETIKNLYNENSEMAIHTVSHMRLDPNFAGGREAMEQEMFGVRAWLNTECGIPLEDLVGFRAPYLISNQITRALLQKEGMMYDSSMISAFSRGSEVSEVPGRRPFPFTMDTGIPIDAMWNYPDGQCNCSTESYPGLFELPMYELQNAAGEHLASMDPEGDVYNIYRENFDMNYKNNRAPFGVYLHAPWFNDQTTAALNQFMEYAMAQPDVWVLTMRQLAEWMKSPVPASKMGEWLTCKDVALTPPVGTVRCQQYTVKSGDSAYSIATAFAVTTEDFILTNRNTPDFGSGENMQPGNTVLIPPWDDGCVGEAVRPVTGPGQVTPQDGLPLDLSDADRDCKTHIAAPQDNWSSVAEIYGVSEADLEKANPDVAGSVSSGVTLRVPPYKDSCPAITNAPRPSILGPSQGVNDLDSPPSGFRINMVLKGRPKIDYEFDLSSPFKLTLGKALGRSAQNVRFAKITQLDGAARRAILQVPQVDLEMTIPEATPLAMYANISQTISMNSRFATVDLKNLKISMESAPVIRIIEGSVTYDVDPSPLAAGTSREPGSSAQESSTSPSTLTSDSSSSGLSTGAIVGIAVGAMVAVLVLAALAFAFIRKSGKNDIGQEKVPSSEQSSPKRSKSVGSLSEDD